MEILTKEEKEEMLNRKIEMMKKRNEDYMRKHKEKEDDRRMAEESGRAVTIKGVPIATIKAADRHSIRSERTGIPDQEDVDDFEVEGGGTGLQSKRLSGAGSSHAGQRYPSPRSNVQKQSSLSTQHVHDGSDGSSANKKSSELQSSESNVRSPPVDPPNLFLADRSREGPLPDSESSRGGRDGVGGRGGMGGQRHPRNFGGASFDSVTKEMKRRRPYDRPGGGAGPTRTDADYTLVTTGRERLEDAQWKRERERIDEERVRRNTAARGENGGEWKREWDRTKGNEPEESEVTPRPVQQYPRPGDQRSGPARRPFGRIGSGRFVSPARPTAAARKSRIVVPRSVKILQDKDGPTSDLTPSSVPRSSDHNSCHERPSPRSDLSTRSDQSRTPASHQTEQATPRVDQSQLLDSSHSVSRTDQSRSSERARSDQSDQRQPDAPSHGHQRGRGGRGGPPRRGGFSRNPTSPSSNAPLPSPFTGPTTQAPPPPAPTNAPSIQPVANPSNDSPLKATERWQDYSSTAVQKSMHHSGSYLREEGGRGSGETVRNVQAVDDKVVVQIENKRLSAHDRLGPRSGGVPSSPRSGTGQGSASSRQGGPSPPGKGFFSPAQRYASDQGQGSQGQGFVAQGSSGQSQSFAGIRFSAERPVGGQTVQGQDNRRDAAGHLTKSPSAGSKYGDELLHARRDHGGSRLVGSGRIAALERSAGGGSRGRGKGRGSRKHWGEGEEKRAGSERTIGVAVITTPPSRQDTTATATKGAAVVGGSGEGPKEIKSILKNKGQPSPVQPHYQQPQQQPNTRAKRPGSAKKDGSAQDDEEWEDVDDDEEEEVEEYEDTMPYDKNLVIRIDNKKTIEDPVPLLGVAVIKTCGGKTVDRERTVEFRGGRTQGNTERGELEEGRREMRGHAETEKGGSVSKNGLRHKHAADENKVIHEELKDYEDIADEEDDDDEWEDVDEDVPKKSGRNSQRFEDDDDDDDDDGTGESFDRFIRAHTLRLDVNVGVAVGAADGEGITPGSNGPGALSQTLFSPDSACPKTPDRVLDWGAAMDELSQERKKKELTVIRTEEKDEDGTEGREQREGVLNFSLSEPDDSMKKDETSLLVESDHVDMQLPLNNSSEQKRLNLGENDDISTQPSVSGNCVPEGCIYRETENVCQPSDDSCLELNTDISLDQNESGHSLDGPGVTQRSTSEISVKQDSVDSETYFEARAGSSERTVESEADSGLNDEGVLSLSPLDVPQQLTDKVLVEHEKLVASPENDNFTVETCVEGSVASADIMSEADDIQDDGNKLVIETTVSEDVKSSADRAD